MNCKWTHLTVVCNTDVKPSCCSCLEKFVHKRKHDGHSAKHMLSDKTGPMGDMPAVQPSTSARGAHMIITAISPIRYQKQINYNDENHQLKQLGRTAVLEEAPTKKALEEKRNVAYPSQKLWPTLLLPAQKVQTKDHRKRQSQVHLVKHCGQIFSDSKLRERWTQCMTCKEWPHQECSGVEYDLFHCDLCVDS